MIFSGEPRWSPTSAGSCRYRPGDLISTGTPGRRGPRQQAAAAGAGAREEAQHRVHSGGQRRLGDFGVYGGTIPTPRIDELASEGIRFNNYNVEVQCTPSRSAILTGRYPVARGPTRPVSRAGQGGLAPWEYTIAELLSDAGYATALFGKWHLGDTQGRLPNDQGFDEWWGIMNSWDEAGYTAWPLFKESGMPVPMIWEGRRASRPRR